MTFTPDSRLVGRVVEAANHERRRGGMAPDLLLLHYTGLVDVDRAIDWLSRVESRVSCHYVIDLDGVITQMVPEPLRAWHAGLSVWAGDTDINSCSVGIEIHNPGHDHGLPEYPEAQIRSVEALSRDIVERWHIVPERVLGHSDVAPLRKIDPGEKFPWARLAAAGVGLWRAPETADASDPGFGPGVGGPTVRDAQLKLAAIGYGLQITGEIDPLTEFVVRAFQRHYRPSRVDGRLDRSTVVTLARVAEAFAVSRALAS